MGYKPRSLFQIIEEINRSVFLPHIQRPFVWTEEQMRRLFDSLMRNYPVQTLLFWRTKDRIKARRFMSSIEWDADLHEYYDPTKSEAGVEKVFVLDGQQRLQTLFALFNGATQAPDGKTDLEAYSDACGGLNHNDDGLLYPLAFKTAAPDISYYRLRDLLGKDDRKPAEEIADGVNDLLDATLDDSGKARTDRQKRVRRNIAQVRSILREDRHFWIEELDGVAESYAYDRILDIFVRVNSGGTKLDAADLMFAAMKEGWDEIEENVEATVASLNGDRLAFDKAFPLKCMVVAHGAGADLGPEKFSTAAGDDLLKQIKENWDRSAEAFQQLRDFIRNDLKVYSDKVVRSYGSFVPIFDYLYHNPKPDPANRALLCGYYYKSQLFNWYGARTDQIIDVIHRIVGKPCGAFPLDDIKTYFSSSRGLSTEITLGHLEDIRLRFIMLNIVYVATTGGSPFDVAFDGNTPQIDHIYPQSKLRSVLGLTTQDINHLGNYRYIGASDNQRKRAELPAGYFSRLKAATVDIGKHLLVEPYSGDPSALLFDVSTYQAFRDARLSAIFDIADRVVNPEKHKLAAAATA